MNHTLSPMPAHHGERPQQPMTAFGSLLHRTLLLISLLTLFWQGGVQAAQLPTTANGNWSSTSPYTKTTPGGLQMRVTLTGPNAIGALNDTALMTQNNTTVPALPATTNGVQVLTTLNSCQTSYSTSLSCAGLGTIVINFTDSAGNPVPVRNPVLHLSRFGGNVTGGPNNSSLYFSATYTLTTPGITMGAPAAGAQNLSVSGNMVGAASVTTSISGACSTTAGANTAGCGSVPLTGTTSQLAFNVGAVRNSTATPSAWDTGASNGSNSTDGVFITVSFDEDFGDAPASYDPTTAASNLLTDLVLGSGVTADNTTVFNGGATGTTSITPSPKAAAAGAAPTGDTDDAFSSLPTLTPGSYTLNVPISGASQSGQVCGWIDFNKGGTFDLTTEQACGTFAAGASSVPLTFTIPSGSTLVANDKLYVRLRASYGTGLTPTGRFYSGETEDYQVVVGADVTADKAAPAAIGSGGSMTYTIRVWNNGPGSTSAATVSDTLPSGFNATNVACAATGTATCGTQSASGTTFSATTGTLSVDTAPTNSTPDGNYLTYTITGTAASSGLMSNTVTVTPASGVTDPTTGNNSSAAVTTRVIDAVNDGPTSLTYNAGGSVNVLANDTVGSNAATTSNGIVSIGSNGGITGLGVDASGNLTVPASTPAGTYTVTYKLCDATVTTACDTATKTITIVPSADLNISKSGPATAVAGTQITYILTLSNAGPSAANGATFGDPLPASLTGVSATCVNATGGVSGCTASVSSNNVTGTVGTFPSGGSVQIQITGTISPGTTGSLSNFATISPPSGTNDPNSADNTSATINTTLLPTLTIVKTSSGGTGSFSFTGGTNGLPSNLTLNTGSANPATSPTYTVTNLTTAANLTETVPAGWQLQGWECKTSGGVSVASGTTPSMSISASTLQLSSHLTCTFTNVAFHTVTLKKNWPNGKLGDSVSLTIGDASQATIGSGSSTAGGSGTDSDATASVLYNTKFYVTEAFILGKGDPNNYNAPSLSCSSGGSPVTFTLETAYSYSFTMQSADITCTYTNSRKSATLQLAKTWTNGKNGDQASIGATTGGLNNTAAFTATAPAAANSGPPILVYAGDTLTLPAETMSPGLLSNYATTVACTGGTQTGSNGQSSGNTLAITPAQSGAAIVCTYNNARLSQQFNLAKVWGAGSVSGDTASATTTGNASATFSAVAPASTNGAVITVYAGDTLTLPAETLSRSLYLATVECTGGTPLSSGPTGRSITITNSGLPTTCTYTNSIPALSISKANPSSLTVGTSSDYTITVTNTGSAATTASSTVSDTIPSGLTIGALPGGCAAIGQTITCTVAAGLSTGGTVSFTIPVTPTAALAGTAITNTATVTGGGSPCTVSTCSSTTPALTVTGFATLSLSKGVTAPNTTSNYVLVKADPINSTALTYTPAQQMQYYLTVSNTSDITATNVTVNDTLPGGLSYVSATMNGSPISNSGAGAQNLSFTVGTLPARTSQTIVITVNLTVTPNTNQTALLNTASTTATGVTTVNSNAVKTDLIYTKVFKQVHNVGISPTATVPLPTPAWSDAGTGYPSEQLEYCIDFTNYSTIALKNYVVSDTIPSNTTFVAGSAYVLQGSLSDITTSNPTPTYMSITPVLTGDVVSATISSLPPGTTGSLCFRVQIR